jgi:2-C-methyl-D-erythritol 4-phosphate cytidylyltransferase
MGRRAQRAPHRASTTTLSASTVHGHPGPRAATVGVIVPAAGLGRRLGDNGPKALFPLAGRPLLAHALADLEATECVSAVVVATNADAMAAVGALAARGVDGTPFSKVVAVVPGGATRQRSVAAGLAALPADVTHAAVHDAARPLAGPGYLDELLRLLLAETGGCCGVVPGLPVTDTVREVDGNGRSMGTIDREGLRGMQTPQLFLREVLDRAHAAAGRDGIDATDDATLVERAGGAIRVVPGRAENLKVTTVLDVLLAEMLLSRRDGSPGSRPGRPAASGTPGPPA